ncbi:hypothetical protein L484_002368 [Morus notabilis]|uniref:Uncharacterized protein n=1 Tax=Morus notabilis TaxID=981085 RepID=W9RXV2_9ROSA|nr:hypothetical protein L484_002368 [Morus notabilis]
MAVVSSCRKLSSNKELNIFAFLRLGSKRKVPTTLGSDFITDLVISWSGSDFPARNSYTPRKFSLIPGVRLTSSTQVQIIQDNDYHEVKAYDYTDR